MVRFIGFVIGLAFAGVLLISLFSGLSSYFSNRRRRRRRGVQLRRVDSPASNGLRQVDRQQCSVVSRSTGVGAAATPEPGRVPHSTTSAKRVRVSDRIIGDSKCLGESDTGELRREGVTSDNTEPYAMGPQAAPPTTCDSARAVDAHQGVQDGAPLPSLLTGSGTRGLQERKARRCGIPTAKTTKGSISNRISQI